MVAEDARLAAVIASRLAEQIVNRKLQPGTHVGTEAELMERFGVSRDPLREAIRILEWQGLVAASRGRRGGGLRVHASPEAALIGMLRTYLQLSDISLGEVLECIGILNYFSYQQVVQRATRAQIARIREAVAKARAEFEKGSTDVRLNVNITREIATAEPNHVARVLVLALAETSVDFTHAGRLPRLRPSSNLQLVEYFEALLVAVEERDFSKVWKIHEDILRLAADSHSALERRNSKIWNTHSFLMGDYTDALVHMSGRQKRAAAIAYQVAAYIRRSGLAPGTPVDVEAAGVKERSVSRAVLREAIRLLEFFGVIEVRRGNEGGLFAIQPNPSHILVFAQIYLRSTDLDAKQMTQLREHLGATAVQLCASKLSTAGVLTIRHHAEQFTPEMDAAAAAEVAHEIGRLILTYAGNRALLLFGEVLFVLARDERAALDAVYRRAQVRERSMEAVSQLSTAFLKSNEAEMIDALNALRRLASNLA